MNYRKILYLSFLLPVLAAAQTSYQGTITAPAGASTNNLTTAVPFSIPSGANGIQCDASVYVNVGTSSVTAEAASAVEVPSKWMYPFTTNTSLRYVAVRPVSGAASCRVFYNPSVVRILPMNNPGSNDLTGTGTASALTYYVETTGSDNNDCLSLATACATINATVQKIPRVLHHPVVVQVGTGSFTAGAYVNGFVPSTAVSAASGPSLLLTGSLVDATLVSGSVTGTVSSVAAGSGKTWGVVTPSGAPGWTVNDLRGKWVEYSTGRVDLISSNTATAFTTAGAMLATVPLPTNGTTFRIREVGTSITGMLPVATAPSSSTVTGDAAFHVEGPVVGSVSPTFGRIIIQRFKFVGTDVTRAIHIATDNNVLVKDCRFEMTGANARAVYLSQRGAGRIQSNSVLLNSTGTFIEGVTQSTSDFLLIQSNVSVGGGNWTFLQGWIEVFRSNSNYVENVTRVHHFLGFDQGALQSDKYQTASDMCIRGDLDPSNHSFGHLSISGTDMNGCANAAVEARGKDFTVVFSGDASTGSGGSYGINVYQGATVETIASTAITGSTADINLEGTTYSYAAFRAAPNKTIISVKNSTITEM